MKESSEYSFPFDSEEPSPGNFDRVYYAEDFARYIRPFFKSGIFQESLTSLKVIANGDMTVTLKPGRANIDGYRYDNTDDIIIPLSPPDGVLNRIDRIAITWMNEERDIYCTLQEGTFSYDPVPPECRRNADYKDYIVAEIYIKAGTISINQTDITDTREDESICGFATRIGDVGAGGWIYDSKMETLIWNSEFGKGVGYDKETETLMLTGGWGSGVKVDMTAVAEQAAAIVQDSLQEITAEEVEQAFNAS